MKLKSLFLIFVLALLLAACGGNDANNDANVPRVLPTSTAAPTLSVDERVNFAAGLAENPLRMVIRPVDTVNTRIAEWLPDVLNLSSNINSQTVLSDDLDDDDKFAALNAMLQRDFEVEISEEDRQSIENIADLITFVQHAVARKVSDDIFDLTGLYVDVILADHYSDALSDLCNSGSGIVSIPWLDGMTYMAAASQNCGQPALQVVQSPEHPIDFLDIDVNEISAESTPDPSVVLPSDREDLIVGTRGTVVINTALGAQSLDVVNDRTFCRLSLSDFYSWFLPTIIMRQVNIDLLRAPAQVIEYESYDALLAALEEGACAMSGVPEALIEATDSDGVQVIARTANFPFGVLMYPLEVELGVRLSLNENFIKLADDPIMGRHLRLLLGQDAILPAVPDDFAELTQFLGSTGYDFAQLGY